MRLNNKEEITMSKSIASKTLAIAKRQEEERLEAVKEEFLNIMRKEFEERINSCDPWTALGNTHYVYHETFGGFKISDLRAVCEKVGFLLIIDSCRGVGLSIPKWIKGQKRTQAQLMLYWSNIEIKRNIKSRKDAAKRMCQEALEKIKNGDFVTSKCIDSYEIKVIVSYSEDNRKFEDEVARIFAKKNFKLLNIDVESGTWRFRIKES